MKRSFRLLFRFFLLLLVLFISFIVFVLNPQVLYARERHYRQTTIYSANTSPPAFNKVLDKATELIRPSELYDSSFHFDVFMNDGASFTPVLKKVLGDAFAWGYHNNVVLNGENNAALEFIHLNGHQRHLARTIAHEMIHCLQANHFGLFHSRPLKNVPYWKWEGYPEYICYRSTGLKEDSILISNLAIMDSLKNATYAPVDINIEEGKSFAGLDYFRWWLMVKYCMDINGMTFAEILKDDVKYDTVYKEMMDWYYKNHKRASPPAGP